MADIARFQLTEDQLAPYRATVAARRAETGRRRAERCQQAWQAARAAAGLLRSRFGATRVAVYGSLARGTYGLHSDVEFVAWGIDDRHWLAAPGDIYDLAPKLDLNLVLAQEAKPRLLEAIATEGVDL